MTLKQYLKDARKPERLGTNARKDLKRKGARGTLAMRYDTYCMNVAVNERRPDDKHALFRGALGLPSFLTMHALAV